jgi:outer membrane lipoprotein LolB
MTVHVDASASAQARNVTATFDLRGTPRVGQLDLSTPLGTVLAQARWAPGKVVLVTPQRETLFMSLDELTREVLGESVPVAALFDWLQGRPWPGAPSTPTSAPAGPGFEQLGWVVNLARFDEGLIAARREQVPAVTVRAKLDRP